MSQPDRSIDRRLSTDLAWSALIGGLTVASPLTGASRLVPSLVAGLLVGFAVFAVRSGYADRWIRLPIAKRDATPTGFPPTLPGMLCVGMVTVICLPTIVWLWQQYTESIWRNAHGLFVPLIVFWMARSALRDTRVSYGSDPALASPFLAAGIVFSWLEVTTRLGYPGTIGLILFVPGLCLLVMGREATRRIAGPLGFLVFLLPIPGGLLDPLWMASTAASVSESVLRAAGVPTALEQTVLSVPGLTFGVSANCSGASTLQAALLLALILGRGRSWITKLLLVASIWPITLMANVVRITLMMGGSMVWGLTWFHTFVHGLSGIATFWAVMAGVTLLALVASRATRLRGTPA